MDYRQYLPHNGLRPYIRSYFDVRVDAGADFLFPSDCCPGLIVNLGQPFLLGTANKDLTLFRGCRLFGYLSRQLVIKSVGETRAIAVKFRPGQLDSFCSLPGIELADTCLAVDQIWGGAGKALVHKIYDAGAVGDIIAHLDTFLLKCLNHNVYSDFGITHAFNEILNRNGNVSILSLAKHTNLSRRQFERRFVRAIGLSPKRMCRVARITGVITRLKADSQYTWADIALAGGYADQAHFIRDWKYFTHKSPHAYLNQIRPFESAIVGLP